MEITDSLSALLAEITSNISTLQQLHVDDSTGVRLQILDSTKKLLSEADDKVDEATQQILDLPASQRVNLERSVKLYKVELSRIREEFERASAKQGVTSSLDLFADQHSHLLQNSETLEKASRKLDDGYRIALETEEVGSTILENLGRQRETIQRTRTRLRETDNDLSISGRILAKIGNRIAHGRIQLFGIMVLVVLAIIVAVYFAIRR